MSETRKEKDSLGLVEVPAGAYYGAQTQRAESLSAFFVGSASAAIVVREERNIAGSLVRLGARWPDRESD
jgi:fumarate hydratase class II